MADGGVSTRYCRPRLAVPKREPSRTRTPLSRERVLRTALALVDEAGADALSMRTVAAKLGVEAMSLYRHVADKQDLLLGVADLVVAEIEVPPQGTPWRVAMRRRADSAREVFLRHPHSALLVESCATMTPARLAYADGILGLLVAGGFDASLAYRAFLTLDSYVYGFVMQELGWPHPSSGADAPPPPDVSPERFPHFAAVMNVVMAKVGTHGLVASYGDEFHFGLDLVLDALERSRDGSKSPTPV